MCNLKKIEPTCIVINIIPTQATQSSSIGIKGDIPDKQVATWYNAGHSKITYTIGILKLEIFT